MSDPGARLAKELEIHAIAAAALKEHTPRADGSDTICACGMMFQRIDARAWHRHAASMVLNAINTVPELQLVMGGDTEGGGGKVGPVSQGER